MRSRIDHFSDLSFCLAVTYLQFSIQVSRSINSGITVNRSQYLLSSCFPPVTLNFDLRSWPSNLIWTMLSWTSGPNI